MNNSNAWHDILFELEMSHIPPAIALIYNQKYSKMEWNQKNVHFMFQMLYAK